MDGMDDSITIVLESSELLSGICGVNDTNLKIMEDSLGGRIAARGNEIRLDSTDGNSLRRFRAMMSNLTALVRDGDIPTPEYVQALALIINNEDTPVCTHETAEPAADHLRNEVILIPQGFHRVYPRTKNQAEYIRGMRACDITFSIGPAGTGKTYLAVVMAVTSLKNKEVNRIVLTRPAVEAGEKLGFLPGDMQEKVDPYLRPLYDGLYDILGMDVAQRYIERSIIEIAPLAYMRGRTLDDSFIILDEAQNTTPEQMKMFLTRIGFSSKAVITGDVTQIDIGKSQESGLIAVQRILKGIAGISFLYLTRADIVRHPVVQRIVQAYEEEEERRVSATRTQSEQ